MTDAAQGPANAIRGVVVLTDGQANEGSTQLHDLIQMASRNEKPIERCEYYDCAQAIEVGGVRVKKDDVMGVGPGINTQHTIQIFFIGVGDDADMQVGRMLAEATGADFQGVAEKDLAEVLEEFSKYF